VGISLTGQPRTATAINSVESMKARSLMMSALISQARTKGEELGIWLLMKEVEGVLSRSR
jgi:hypothetical protein